MATEVGCALEDTLRDPSASDTGKRAVECMQVPAGICWRGEHLTVVHEPAIPRSTLSRLVGGLRDTYQRQSAIHRSQGIVLLGTPVTGIPGAIWEQHE